MLQTKKLTYQHMIANFRLLPLIVKYFSTKFKKLYDKNYLSDHVTKNVFTDKFEGTERWTDGQRDG